MPGSIRTVDAPPQRYNTINALSSFEKDLIVVTKRSSTVNSQTRMPPSPPSETEILHQPDMPTMRRVSSRSESPADYSVNSVEIRQTTRDITRGSPGDGAIFSDSKTPEQRALAKRKSQYYGEVFANREPIASARERVMRDSRVIADVRTNVIINDEFTFITELSAFLSVRYQRSEDSIIVAITHSCCMLYGGNFDPAYVLNITALSSQLQPVTNKRNAALLAKHMEESLGVDSKRGVIKFNVIPEDNYAACGKTVAGEIDELEKENAQNNSSLQKNLSRGSKYDSRRQSMKSLRPRTGNILPTHNESMVSLPSTYDTCRPALPPMPTEPSAMDKKAAKAQKIGRRKSFIALLFHKS